jgi:hypothetical protein
LSDRICSFLRSFCARSNNSTAVSICAAVTGDGVELLDGNMDTNDTKELHLTSPWLRYESVTAA